MLLVISITPISLLILLINSYFFHRQYGFQNYLTDLFTCPTTVLQYLCESYNLHNIPIGEERIDNHLEHVRILIVKGILPWKEKFWYVPLNKLCKKIALRYSKIITFNQLLYSISHFYIPPLVKKIRDPHFCICFTFIQKSRPCMDVIFSYTSLWFFSLQTFDLSWLCNFSFSTHEINSWDFSHFR